MRAGMGEGRHGLCDRLLKVGCVRASARQVRTFEAVRDSEGSGTTDSEHDIDRDSTSSSD